LLSLTPPWPVAFALFALLLLIAHAAAIGLIAPADRRPSVAEAVTAAAFGLLSLGFLLMFARWASLPTPTPILLMAAIALVITVRRQRRLVPRFERTANQSPIAAVAAVAFLLPAVIGGVTMAQGDYPAVFFQAATPFRLTHAYQFVADRGMPPHSLSNLGIYPGYHYGGPAAAAAAALFTGLKVHTAFFLTLITATAGIVGIAILLARSLRGQLPFQVAFPLILAGAPLTAWSLGKAPLEWFSDPQLFFNHFPDISIYFGTFALLVVTYGCLNLSHRRFIVLAILGTLIIATVKSSYYPVAGLLVFSGALVKLYRTSDLRWLLLPAIAFVAGSALLGVSGAAMTQTLVIEPFFFLVHFKKQALKYGLDLAVYLLPVAVYFLCTRATAKVSKQQADGLLLLALTLAGLYLFLNLFGHYASLADGSLTPNDNIIHPLRMAPKLLAAFAIIAVGALWTPERRRLNAVVLAYLGLLIVVPLAHKATHAMKLVVDRSSAHEAVDNGQIAEALAHIPVEGSVIVTNDLRYPANDFKRDRLQMQIPGIFGHQAYAVNTKYELYPESELRVKQQERFQLKTWDASLSELSREAGWTHLLVHKAAPHPEKVPLKKIFENETYTVYSFQ
jgi:hypothetical protein